MIDLDEEAKDTYLFRMAGTGHAIGMEAERLVYMNTIHVDDLVFHFFSVPR